MSRRQGISVLVVDGHPVVREYLAERIAADERLALAGEAGDRRTALRELEGLRPDAVVLDADMPRLDAAAILREMRSRHLAVRVLAFTGHATPDQLRAVLQEEPDSLLRKGVSAAVLCREIVAMVRDEPSAGRFRREGAQAVAPTRLTLDERERIVLAFAAKGRSVAALAARLAVSQRTAKAYRHDLREKFEADSMEGVVAKAMRLGLLE